MKKRLASFGMTKRQLWVLALLGIIDLLAICGILWVIVSSFRQKPDTASVMNTPILTPTRMSTFDDSRPRWSAEHQDWVFETAFSPDGQILATASADYTVSLWNVENGSLIRMKLPPKTRPHAKWKWCTILTKHVEGNNDQASHIYCRV